MSADNVDQETAALSVARTLLAQGEARAAGVILQRLAMIATRLQSRLVAELLIAARLPDDATDLAVRIAAEQDDAWPWLNHFAGHMRARGDLNASQLVLRAFIASHPARSIDRLHADAALALGLPSAYRDNAELSEIREKYFLQLQHFVASYPPNVLLDIHARADDLARTNFYLAYQGEDDLVSQNIYGDWLVESLRSVAPSPLPVHANNERPTIALVSSKWNECTVGWYFASWVEQLSRSWNVALVHTSTARRDALTQRLASKCQSDIVLSPSLDTAASQIRALAPDIVLYPELGTDGFTFALAAQRIARVQVCAWGHPVTTGLSTVDAFFTCDAMEPDGAAAHYRERLIGLPGIGTRYASPSLPSPKSASELGLPIDRPLYFMPQALHKWHPDTDRILAEVVRRDPSARFVMFELRPPSPAQIIFERLTNALAEVSAHPAEHFVWLPECSRDDYLRINQACSVMIDTPHWSGGNATLDALLCGLPIVTVPGRFMRGRQSAAMLRLIGCDELIAASVDELADIAVSLAHDATRRGVIAERIRHRLPSLTQSDAPLLALDECLRSLLHTRSN